jgi:hypothetical protein
MAASGKIHSEDPRDQIPERAVNARVKVWRVPV